MTNRKRNEERILSLLDQAIPEFIVKYPLWIFDPFFGSLWDLLEIERPEINWD